MTVGREKYAELLDQFRAISEPYITEEVIRRLKEDNRKRINSARVLEKIKDIKSLLCVLEKRGIVQYNDISALKCIAKDFVRDKTVEELISNYELWLEKNSANVNFLYSCGKSHTLLNQNNFNKHKISESANSCDILINIRNNASEEKQSKCEQCTEPLLPKDPCTNIISSNFIENINNFTTIVNETKPPKRIKKRRYIISLIISFILLSLLICIIWFIMKLYSQSSAIVPQVDPPGPQTSMETNRSRVPQYISNMNVGITAQSSFVINQTQNTVNTSVHVPAIDLEKEIQDIIIRKISKRIGKFWKDVCRYLHFQEGEIIAIEFDNARSPRTFENMFKEALQMYFSDEHPNWRIDLMNALSKANRNDLKDTVLEIVSKRNFQ